MCDVPGVGVVIIALTGTDDCILRSISTEPAMKRDVSQLFPSVFYGRITLGLASLAFGLACWFVTFVFLMHAWPSNASGWFFLLLVEELFLALFEVPSGLLAL